MADYTSILMLGLTLLLSFLVFHRKHPFIESICYIVIGAASFMIFSSNNAYGLIIIAIGFIRFLSAPVARQPTL